MNEPVKDFGFERKFIEDVPGHFRWISSEGFIVLDIMVGQIFPSSGNGMSTEQARRFVQLLQLAIRVHEQMAAGVEPEKVDFGPKKWEYSCGSGKQKSKDGET